MIYINNNDWNSLNEQMCFHFLSTATMRANTSNVLYDSLFLSTLHILTLNPHYNFIKYDYLYVYGYYFHFKDEEIEALRQHVQY